ncbi:hypothetical protein ACJX0J_031724, partial [Zea mays]
VIKNMPNSEINAAFGSNKVLDGSSEKEKKRMKMEVEEGSQALRLAIPDYFSCLLSLAEFMPLWTERAADSLFFLAFFLFRLVFLQKKKYNMWCHIFL